MRNKEFLSGVVEGFYGRPWSSRERLRLFDRLNEFGLNTYFYAPKDDLKHRAIWRELYADSELDSVAELVHACGDRQLQFIYGLSPGLDIRFSDRLELDRIRDRFTQLRGAGVRHFALLFDDLPGELTEADRNAYPALSAAHCDVANRVFDWLRENDSDSRFLFCPTPYCDAMDRQQLGGASYLDDVGRLLNPGIDLLWTGPDIVSREIPIESIEGLIQRIGRPPVIWDNLFANDYDMHRLHCGPYAGRSHELLAAVRGILINPNNEYPINEVPMRTFAEFVASDGSWNPREAFLRAVAEWHADFTTVRAPLSLDDLILLADSFYLPHSEGPEARKLLAAIQELSAGQAACGSNADATFVAMNGRLQRCIECLTELRDRDLFQAWSRHGWQLKEDLLRLDAVFARKRAQRESNAPAVLDEGPPDAIQYGMLARLERCLAGQESAEQAPATAEPPTLMERE